MAIFNKYNVNDCKLQHDMLACHEGLAILNDEPTFCKYDIVHPYNTGLNGTQTLWEVQNHVRVYIEKY